MIQNNIKKFTTAIATGAVLLSSVAPAFAATTQLTISGNGRGSNNDVAVSQTNTTSVSQSNNAYVNNNTTVNSNTGNNRANDNLGGAVSVRSGDANADVRVQTAANKNVANVAGCSTCASATTVDISGNGRNSTNDVGLTQRNSTSLGQNNYAEVNNNTTVNANTGNNRANDNLGGANGVSDVSIRSGNTNANVGYHTAVNSNAAQLGGGTGAGAGGNTLTARILGNGRNSSNTIALSQSNSASVSQSNDARVNNNTTVNSNTGNNRANDNLGGSLGGDVRILTGNAKANVMADTQANFNAAALDSCGCVTGAKAVISGNGRNSTSYIGATLSNSRSVFQGSTAAVNNNTVNNDNTGNNRANDNGGTLAGFTDPSVQSGNSAADVRVATRTNENAVGSAPVFPFFSGSNSNVSFSFDWSGMMASWYAWMGMHM